MMEGSSHWFTGEDDRSPSGHSSVAGGFIFTDKNFIIQEKAIWGGHHPFICDKR